MELSVGERLVLMMVLPPNGDLVTMKIVQKLRGDLGFDEGEIERFGIRNEEGQVLWDGDKAEAKDIEIGPKAMEVVVRSLRELSEKKQLTLQHLPLCEKFMEAD